MDEAVTGLFDGNVDHVRDTVILSYSVASCMDIPCVVLYSSLHPPHLCSLSPLPSPTYSPSTYLIHLILSAASHYLPPYNHPRCRQWTSTLTSYWISTTRWLSGKWQMYVSMPMFMTITHIGTTEESRLYGDSRSSDSIHRWVSEEITYIVENNVDISRINILYNLDKHEKTQAYTCEWGL